MKLDVHAAIASRRSRLYRLLGRCFHDRVDAGLVRELHDELKALRGDRPHALETADLERALWKTMETPAAIQELEGEFARLAQALTPDPLAAEHLGPELQVMAVLCMTEARAWKNSCEREARHMLRRQVDFLEAHLLDWLAALYDQVICFTAHPVCVCIARFIGAACRHDRRMAAEFLEGASCELFEGRTTRSVGRNMPPCTSMQTWRAPLFHAEHVNAAMSSGGVF
jgi:TorA maturation chaperone TorD